MKKIGRYEIVGELGRGAMGVVYKASDPTIGRLVALKVLSLGPPAEEGAPSAKDIFMREARAAGRLTHPSIVTIHDAFEDPESTLSCIVMEMVPGRTLERILQSGQGLTPEQALGMARQVAEGLDYAHQQQVIHRDLKPANILLTDDGRVKITDFGIAKITAREGAARTFGIMGTPSYMSPEQVTGGEVDARSDLFSLGIVLYLALTGQKPFVGDTAAVMFKIAYEDPVLPSTLNPRLSPGHDYLVLRCLAKDRAKRYSAAREFLDDLEDVENGRPPRSQAEFPATALPTAEGDCHHAAGGCSCPRTTHASWQDPVCASRRRRVRRVGCAGDGGWRRDLEASSTEGRIAAPSNHSCPGATIASRACPDCLARGDGRCPGGSASPKPDAGRAIAARRRRPDAQSEAGRTAPSQTLDCSRFGASPLLTGSPGRRRDSGRIGGQLRDHASDPRSRDNRARRKSRSTFLPTRLEGSHADHLQRS